MVPKYAIPTLQEILPQLSSGKHKTFTIVDALDGFTQVRLDAESSKLTTMSTSWGQYQWNRLPYGVSSAVEFQKRIHEFQKRIHEIVEGLEGVEGITHDLLVYGVGDTEGDSERDHDKCLLALLDRAREKLEIESREDSV